MAIAAGRYHSLALSIRIPPNITLEPLTLAPGFVGVAYNATITSSGGVSPYTFSITAARTQLKH